MVTPGKIVAFSPIQKLTAYQSVIDEVLQLYQYAHVHYL